MMHLKPTAGCHISTLIFEKKMWRRSLCTSHKKYIKEGKLWSGWSLLISNENYIKEGKDLVHLGFTLTTFLVSSTDLSA
jgi:hypothetical protein